MTRSNSIPCVHCCSKHGLGEHDFDAEITRDAFELRSELRVVFADHEPLLAKEASTEVVCHSTSTRPGLDSKRGSRRLWRVRLGCLVSTVVGFREQQHPLFSDARYHRTMANRILLLPLLMCFLNIASAQQVVWQINDSGTTTMTPTVVAGTMEVFISGNGNLLPSNALPTDMVAVLNSPNVQNATVSVQLGSMFTFSSSSDNPVPGELTLTGSAGSVLDWEVNANGSAPVDDHEVFPPGVFPYVSAFSYDTMALGVPGGLNETVYPAISFSTDVDGQLFQSTNAPTVTIKGASFIRCKSGRNFRNRTPLVIRLGPRSRKCKHNETDPSREDVPEAQLSLRQSRLHRRSPDFSPDLQRTVRSSEVVVATEQLQVVFKGPLLPSVARCSPMQVGGALANRQVEPFNERGVQLARIFGVL